MKDSFAAGSPAFDEEKTQDVVHSETVARSHSTQSTPTDYDDISYGQNGIKGLLASPYVVGAAFLASLGGFSFGYDQGVISLILTMDQFHNRFPETKPGHPGQGFYTGFMTAMLELGAFLGCLVYPWFADRYSRKWGLSIAVVWFTVGAVIQTAAVDYGMLVAGRTIGGVGVGTLALGAPLYISEVAPPNLRGSLLVLETFSIVIGAIIAYWITYGTAEMTGEWSFRLPFLLQIVPALCVGLGIHFFPFSPRWLCMRDRSEDSLQSLSRLRRLPIDDHRVQLEWRGIIAETGFSLEISEWIALFKPKYWRRTMIAMAIPFFQQFSGINAFVYYAPTLFAALGQDKDMSLILSGMINICQLVGACITTIYLDQMGRRRLAIAGGIMMGVPHAILAGLVGLSTFHGPAWSAVALVYIYVLMYGLTYGPLGWTLPSEVYPNAVRAKGVGWIANFIIGVSVPPMLQGIGFGTNIESDIGTIDRLFKDNSGVEEAAIRETIANEVMRS
ncbi:hypothetical protein PRZ48_007040 [Zasmidium cellare]|uniref:Major facilitator superfamily (MFS) profile domain-containing protein n=1 Tax=Zasmidium cellare TaxID=395010 RepID=A0ABR0EKA9_ZASCE|nr:hypothetical protein PRZ48_007040 [Zasmidium cellare]